jgi:ATP synthase protein I
MDVQRLVPLTLLAQAGASSALAALLWITFGDVVAASTLLGGAAAVVPNAFLAARVLKPSRDVSARAMMRAAWLGEIGKILLTVLVFGLIFGYVRPISPLAVFAGFIAAQLVMFAALLVGGRAASGSSAREALRKS